MILGRAASAPHRAADPGFLVRSEATSGCCDKRSVPFCSPYPKVCPKVSLATRNCVLASRLTATPTEFISRRSPVQVRKPLSSGGRSPRGFAAFCASGLMGPIYQVGPCLGPILLGRLGTGEGARRELDERARERIERRCANAWALLWALSSLTSPERRTSGLAPSRIEGSMAILRAWASH